MKTNILKSTWIGFGKVISRTYSRLDSLSIVSRQSDLRTYSAESSCETFSVGQCSPHAFPFEAKSQLASSHQSVLAILVACLTVFGVGNAWGDIRVDFTPGTETGATYVTKNNVSCTMTTMNNASYYQIYANQTGSFTCTAGNITKIEFTCTASGTDKYGPGNASANKGTYSYDGYTGTWTGDANSVNISTTVQIRMTSLSVWYASSDPYTVTFNAEGGTCGTASLEEESGGAGVELPAASPSAACASEGWAFYGWATAAVGSSTTTAPTIVGRAGDTYYPASDNITLHAVYAQGEYTKETSAITSGSKYLIVVNYSSKNYILKSSSADYNTTSHTMASAQINETSSNNYHAAAVNANWCYTIDGSTDNWRIHDVVNATNNYLDIAYTDWWGKAYDSDDPYKITVSAGVWSLNCHYYYNSKYNDAYLSFDETNKLFQAGDDPYSILLYKAGTINYWSSPSCCDKGVAVSYNSAGSTHISTMTFSAASTATCGGESTREVTVTVTPSSGYFMKSGDRLTWSKTSGTIPADPVYVSGPTDNGNGTWSFVYRFAQNDNGVGKFAARGTTLTNYRTVCCTELGSVNGAASRTTPTTATLTWSNVTGAEKYQVKVPGSSSHDGWTDATSGVSVTGLTCGTAYTANFRAIDTNGSHCSTGPESTTAVPAVSWTVTSTGVTNATASPAIPSTTCSGFSTTISAATGYALPAEITVTNASKTWNSSTGALTISSVTGNVSITITPTCVSPVISGDPADASYYVGDSPDALSVSATLASGTLTYLWKVSTDGGSVWSNADGTNNEATYSGASLSTASAGTIKFKCVVGNSDGGCSVESGVATITVNAASSWKLKGSWDSWEEHTMIEDAGVASYSISLDADSRFEFGFDGGSFYKNNGTIITTTSGWVFNTTDNNCHIHTGPAGTYTFAINISTKAVTVTYPTVSHPNEHYVYFKNTNVWGTVYGYLANSGNDNKAAAWPGSVMQPTTTICGETYHYAALNAMSGTYNTIIFNNGNTGYGNQTSDLSTTGSLGKYNANQDANWHQFKYAIRFDKGSGSGDAMASIENLCPGSNQALTANTYTKEHHTFAGWIADVAVKVGESTIDAGEIIDDEVTIKDIQSDINLTAQWTPNTYTITKTLTNVSNAGLPSSFTYTGSTTDALNSTFTVDATNFFLPSSITVTMGGATLTEGTDYTYNSTSGAFTFSAVITGDIVITATATAKLKSIAITTQPTTRKYFEGESFSSTGAVVTATMGDGSTKAVTASTTWTPPATPLAAGTGLTVTASYTENAINMTATTTIDVYSVTVNKLEEDEETVISVDGVTATWTVGTKALAAGVGSTKYVFKEWQVTGATAASTTSASTTLSSPTANVVVNAIFYKPRVVKWSVNGDDSYATGGPTTEVAYNGTISTVPTAPSGLVCAGTFVAWTDAAHNNGTTAKASTSYYESKLFTAANQFPNITAETTTFYAVFAEGTGAAVNTVMWSEDWTGATTSDGSTGKDEAKPSAQGSHSGKTIYGGGSVTYEESSNATYVRNENTGGGTAPELMIKASEAFTISGIPSGGASELTLTYKRNNQALTPTVSGTDYSISYVSGSGKDTHTYTITCGSGTTFNLIFTAGSSNVRLDDVQVKVKTVNLTDYVTECDANIVSVTYNANGGATSCTNTTTDKTEDYTVCSTPPTRDYYTFAGWLCSADDEVYAANATIDDAIIDDDFTLTAQWTPVPYSITYELYGGTNSGSNPATYNVTTATITLQDPTKGHDRFEGWFSTYSAGVYSDPVTSIPLGSHGDITLHAKWAERHEIIFDADGTTTTIYRADDENLEDDVAEQGSVPGDPSAPTACSSKVFVGWSESIIDGETDTEPGDLMKPAAGAVDEDKHYYAVWATESSSSGPVTVFNDAFQQVTNGDAYDDNKAKADKYTASYVYGTGTAGEARLSSSKNAGSLDIDLSDKTLASSFTITFKLKRYSTETGSVTLSCIDDGSTASFGSSPFSYPTGDDNWHDCSSTVTSVNASTQSVHFASTSGKRVYIKDIVITQTGTIYSYSAYSTSCCATKVTLSENSPEHGTITFGKTKVGTCGDQNVSLTITPEAGYQLHSYEVATGGGKVATKSVSPAISLDNNSSAAQNITLTFADEANGAYDVTASFTEMTVTSWTWTMHDGGGAIPNPLNLYVGQNARVDVEYNPSSVLSTHKNYSRSKDDTYINWPGGAQPSAYCTFIGKASTGENTTTITLTHSDAALEQLVYVKVLPLPLVHFEDLVHGKQFADVAATIEANALSATKTTPTSDDWTTPNANSCEENHLHLVGWIREDWPALVAYLAGTGDAPSTEAIVGAGNDGSGNAYFFTAGTSIDVQTFNGVTFYAVWAKVE